VPGRAALVVLANQPCPQRRFRGWECGVHEHAPERPDRSPKGRVWRLASCSWRGQVPRIQRARARVWLSRRKRELHRDLVQPRQDALVSVGSGDRGQKLQGHVRFHGRPEASSIPSRSSVHPNAARRRCAAMVASILARSATTRTAGKVMVATPPVRWKVGGRAPARRRAACGPKRRRRAKCSDLTREVLTGAQAWSGSGRFTRLPAPLR